MNLIQRFFNLGRYIIPGTLVITLSLINCHAQYKKPKTDSVYSNAQIDIFDVLRKLTKKPKKPIDTAGKGKPNLSFLPVIGYSPANGAVLGMAVSVTTYMGDPKTTNLTTALLNASVTTKDQVILNLRYDLYTAGNKWYISGDNRLLFFSQPTYGLGIYGLNNQPFTFNINGISATTNGSLEQPLKYNYIRLYETFLRKINEHHWYAGLGVMIDYNFKIQDESLKLDSPIHLTSHYIYSKAYGFNSTAYSADGLAAQIMHDSRDNPINPYRGYYLEVTYRVNPEFLGSSQNSTMLYYEFRTYVNVNKDLPQNLIAFWFWGTNVLTGHVPYLELPSITWDTYNRSGRGYIQGRFRGDNMLYGEAEFRFRITENGLLAGVTFIDCTTASNPLPYVSQSLFDAVAPGVGVGLRIKMNKADRTNITVDYGVGNGFAGIYLNLREAF
jgi:outer membrane protein assembly factor BamA